MKEENIKRLPFSKYQDFLKNLAQLDPDESLDNIAQELKEELNCETVCILLWNEAEQKLVTEYQSGLPDELARPERYGSGGRERYGLQEGITGKYIFSQSRLINGLVDLDKKTVFDFETDNLITDNTINWHNMQVFEHFSRFKKFHSLLGAPCFNQNQKPGVVKLINKIDEETGQLAEKGFSKNDVDTLKLSLKTIEYILQSKWNEKRIDDLFSFIQQSADSTDSSDDILKDLVTNCAEVLNYRVCVVRLLENGWLNTKACNLEPPAWDDYTPDNDPPMAALKRKTALKWNVDSDYERAAMVFQTFAEDRTYFPKPSRRITSLIRKYNLKSALIVPIVHTDVLLGTFECYTFLPHEFSHQEKDVISRYANSLITILNRFRESERLSQIERLTKITSEVLSKDTLTNLYELILDQTISYFGFDYGAISRVDYRSRRVRTESGRSNNRLVVDPMWWTKDSDYSLDDTDILVDIVKNKRAEIISGPAVEENWDHRLNREIYDRCKHKELVRIFVPFILNKGGPAGRQNGGKGSKLVEGVVLGIIEAGYHVSTRRDIPEKQRAFFELFIDYCAGAFGKLILEEEKIALDEEKVALDRILEKLNTQENLLSSAEEIYATLRDTVEECLQVNTVSIWEKIIWEEGTASEPFKLKRVAASKLLEEQYDKENIWDLPQDSFTAEAITSGNVTEIMLDETTLQKFAYPHIALKNNWDSLLIIPISIGQETYAVVDVFFGPDRRLTGEEKEFLERFAGRAAVAMIAVQNAKLVKSFSNISETLLDNDIEVTLKSITDSAMEVLHANPVILFRYENDENRFVTEVIASGNFFEPAVRDIPEEIKDDDWPSLILNLNQVPKYLETEQDYLDFQQQSKRAWRGDRFSDDFWHREQIKSSAALRLEHKGEPLGVLFVNYRTPQKFNDPTRKLIEAFAAQAAVAIANAKYSEQHREFWEVQHRDSFALSVSEIVASLAHNSGNLLNIIKLRFANFDNYLKKTEGRALDKERAQSFMEQLKGPLTELMADFQRLEEYRKFNELQAESCQVEDLIKSSLFMLRNRFETNKITVKENYGHTPKIPCDKNQVQHLLLNLFFNALDAMGRKGTLSVGTDVADEFVRIRVTDSGVGISPDNHSEIFKPFFTTKKHGTGLGLPISRYIAQKHGGRIDFTSKPGKESTFLVYLPIQR